MRILRISAGILCIILSIIGGLLPIMPGFIFFILGVSLLVPDLETEIKKLHTKYRIHHDLKKLIIGYYTVIKNYIISKFR